MTTLTFETLRMNAALPGPANPLPVFRDPQADRTVRLVEPVDDRFREGLGKDCGYRILPYGRQDTYDRQRRPHDFRAAVLENDRLRAVFLPKLGGRLISLVDKLAGKDLLYRNPCLQVANLAIRDAWFSGGIEWNIGQFGHACHTCSPVFAGRTRTPDGSVGLRIGEYERMKGLFWQIDFRLSETEPVLWAHVTVTNPLDRPTGLYWWTNIAVAETPGARVVAPADQALCLMPGNDGIHTFAQANLPGLPSLAGRDGTYADHSPFANEFFFLCRSEEDPWEAVVDARGEGLFETSTRELSYRKLFVWGAHPGGRRWQDYLAPEGGGTYLEIQAGLAPSQLHGLTLGAGETRTWTEAFGPLRADPVRAHGDDWPQAQTAVRSGIRAVLPAGRLAQAAAEGREAFRWPLVEVHTAGSAWGRLEQERLGRTGAPLPGAGVAFAEPQTDPEAGPWYHLLTKGTLPEAAPGTRTGWMIQPEWRPLVEASLAQFGGAHAQAWLHYGVLVSETGDLVLAQQAWTESWRLSPSLEAARNLAWAALRAGDRPQAEDWYTKAVQFPGLPVELVREVLEFWLADGSPDALNRAGAFLDRVNPHLLSDDRVGLLTVRLSLAKGDWQRVLDHLDRDWACIREGEISTSDLWIGAQAGLLAAARGVPVSRALRDEAERLHPVPSHLDFRMK